MIIFSLIINASLHCIRPGHAELEDNACGAHMPHMCGSAQEEIQFPCITFV